MNNQLLLHPKYTLVIVMGTPYYDDLRWMQLPQVRNNCTRFMDCINDVSILGVPRSNFVEIRTDTSSLAYHDLENRVALRRNISSYLSVIFYFTGHGLRKMQHEKKLMLACRDTVRDTAKHVDGVEFNDVLALLKNLNNLQSKIIILDCCHAGAIDDDLLGGSQGTTYYSDLNFDIQGTYFIGAAPKDASAGAGNAMFGGAYTEFTGVLTSLMEDGYIENGNHEPFISSAVIEQRLEQSRLTALPHVINRLIDKKGNRLNSFFFFKNKGFSVKGIEQLLAKNSQKSRDAAISLFTQYLAETSPQKLNSEAIELEAITKKMISLNF